MRIGPALRIAWLLAAGFLAGHGVSRSQQQGMDRIRVQTTLVNVPVIVSDRQGGTVRGLLPEDFALHDDGVRQPLAFFATASTPIRIALLLDTSKSTTTVLDRIRKAAAGFLEQLRPQDQALIVTFDSEVNVLCRFTSEQEDLRRAIRGAAVGNYVGSRMWDAVKQVVEKYMRASQDRKAIILLSDGQDFGSQTKPDDAIRAVMDSGVVVYPVFYAVDMRELAKKLFGVSLPKGQAGAAGWEADKKAAAAGLRRVAEESAGSFFQSEVTDFKKAFARVAEELRNQYLLAFYPDPSRLDGNQHRLTVLVARDGLEVRARRSYQANREERR